MQSVVSSSKKLNSLRILFVGVLPPNPGGGELSAWEILTQIANRGHQVRALAPLAPDNPTAPRPMNFSVSYYRVPSPVYSGHSWPDFSTYRRYANGEAATQLDRLIEAERPDLIFANHEMFAWFVPRIAAAHSIPSILRCGGGGLFGLMTRNRATRDTQGLLRDMRLATQLVTPARFMARFLEEQGVPSLRVIANGIDLTQFTPGDGHGQIDVEFDLRRRDIVVLMPCQLVVRKRPMDLIESAKKTLAVDPRLVYLVVGDGPFLEPMKAACRQLGLTNRFRFVGRVEYGRMRDFFRRADIVVLPSEEEGMARVYLEAQACGRALLASDIPSAREQVSDGKTGLLFRTGDPTDLSEKTLLLANDSILRAEIGRRAYAASRSCGLDRVAEQYVELFLRHTESPVSPSG